MFAFVADSFAGIGFKASPGVCDRVPEWVANAHADDPGREGRAEWTPPVTAHALIPTNCEPYTQNAGKTTQSPLKETPSNPETHP